LVLIIFLIGIDLQGIFFVIFIIIFRFLSSKTIIGIGLF